MSISKKVTIPKLKKMKERGEKIVMVTAYDYPSAIIADRAGVDIILVGDSVGVVELGYENTIPVTINDVIHHAKAVVRGAKRPLIVGDMPFGTYLNPEQAVFNACRIIKESGVDTVKLEGGREVAHIVKAIVRAGIPVLGHIGLTPQRATMLGGYKVQGVDAESAMDIIEDAKSLEEAGAYGVVLEFTAAEVAKVITEELKIPTIGIGSGPYCDGQVLVLHDLVGMTFGIEPHFAKRYAEVAQVMLNAIKQFANEVRDGKFPEEKHTIHMKYDEYKKLTSKFE